MCQGAGVSGSSGGEGSKKQPEATQFDTFESCMSEVTIWEEFPESMMVVVNIVGEAEQHIDKWLGDMVSSHQI